MDLMDSAVDLVWLSLMLFGNFPPSDFQAAAVYASVRALLLQLFFLRFGLEV